MRLLGQVPGISAAALTTGLDDPDPLVRGSAVHALLHLDPDDVGARLLETNGRWSAERTLLACEVAGRAEASRLRPRLAERACVAARDEADARLRAHAAAACVRVLGAGRAAAFVADPEWLVRARLAGALAALPPTPERQAALERLAADTHPTVRGLAVNAG